MMREPKCLNCVAGINNGDMAACNTCFRCYKTMAPLSRSGLVQLQSNNDDNDDAIIDPATNDRKLEQDKTLLPSGSHKANHKRTDPAMEPSVVDDEEADEEESAEGKNENVAGSLVHPTNRAMFNARKGVPPPGPSFGDDG